jgi:hypothetical protein
VEVQGDLLYRVQRLATRSLTWAWLLPRHDDATVQRSVIGIPLPPADAARFLDTVAPPAPPLYRVGSLRSTAQARLAEVTAAHRKARRQRAERCSQ